MFLLIHRGEKEAEPPEEDFSQAIAKIISDEELVKDS